MYRTGFQPAFDESRRSDLDSEAVVVTLTTRRLRADRDEKRNGK